MYPMKRIGYTIDYVKDKLIDQNGVTKRIDEERVMKHYWKNVQHSYWGVNQRELKEILIKNNLLYWSKCDINKCGKFN
ncbi:hypothetical protein RFI_34559 [Reticulomyxa filosa]|uniref:Uncharacterized protein n=1 Tax=Reticulomyxa filosa TaxID=46433 RepID=X6LMM4_RETFI|nr:hypothetical protein RFI_34559 [Reticulomyxa filosa]|eukprot:ETO02854.1 hypothetical protein RFI_34559 [Reticulomyxa filosa]